MLLLEGVAKSCAETVVQQSLQQRRSWKRQQKTKGECFHKMGRKEYKGHDPYGGSPDSLSSGYDDNLFFKRIFPQNCDNDPTLELIFLFTFVISFICLLCLSFVFTLTGRSDSRTFVSQVY